MRRFLAALFTLLLTVSVANAQPISENEAREWVETKGSEILNTIASSDKDKFEKLDNIIIDNVDIPYIAKFVVGKYWKSFDDSQKELYQDMFRRYLLGVYRKFPLNFKGSDIDFNIEQIKTSENFSDIIIPIRIEGITTTSNGQQDIIYISFRIHRKQGKLQLIDLKIAESSLLMAYRNKIYELMQKDQEEIEWFLEDFETWIPKDQENIFDIQENEVQSNEPLLIINND